MHAALPPGASVLELGCGTGRIADPLARLGHRVVGVDASAAMLSHLRHAPAVHASIEDLDLADRFDAVVLASNLVNTHDLAQRAAFLAAARRHLAVDGSLVLQRYAPGDRLASGTAWSVGEVHFLLRDVVDHGDGSFSATLVHRLASLVAEQDFSGRVIDDPTLRATLRSARFEQTAVLTPDRRWVLAAAVA